MNINSYKNFTKVEKLAYISSNQVNLEILEYLTHICGNLQVEVLGNYKGSIMKLAKEGKLKHFCFSTTEAAIVFFRDDDYIERGMIKLSVDEEILHSWICFKYEEQEYVFDPCLDIVCLKKSYAKVFGVKVWASVTAKEVRNKLILEINKPQNETEEYKDMLDLMKDVAPLEYERQSKETRVNSSSDAITSSMFGSVVGYIAEIEEGYIRKLTAHFYDNSIF